ncbi:MAG: radical SAM peptide maturase, CXXX-repeat target family [Terrisporobacter sp.]|uniref:radical SAM peptide maturase, CXXX-repeat target family n=1 Tax=Clostridium sp. TaxID=1506 RepID=UPI00306FDAB8
MEINEVLMGNISKGWEGNGKTMKSITLCVTEDCNLACTYCYMVGKNKKNKLSFEMAKKCVDHILEDRNEFNSDSVVWDFIGGEPFLEIDLIDRICNYIKQKMFLLDHPWFSSYRFSFSSNGILYDTPKVQDFIRKNKEHISIGLSVDGNETKHNKSRIYPDGRGSYSDVVRNVPLWIKQFPGSSTKATFSHDDLPYLKDSIINLWDLGIKIVSANVVFEDVWQDGDEEIFEQQLKELADYIIKHKLWNDYSVRFFDSNIGLPLIEEEKKKNYCGAGTMLAIDCNGNFFPCIRFLDFSLCNKSGRNIGNVDSGINKDKVRSFKALSLSSQSKTECINCEVATGCAWCTGANYDFSDTDTIYQRSTYICKMHKANVRANQYFWKKYSEITGELSPYQKNRLIRLGEYDDAPKYLQFIVDSNMKPHCRYENWHGIDEKMSNDIFTKGIDFSKENNFVPIILGENKKLNSDDYLKFINGTEFKNSSTEIPIFYNEYLEKINICKINGDISILIINKVSINSIYDSVKLLLNNFIRVNIVIKDEEKWDEADVDKYKQELKKISTLIIEKLKNNLETEVNVLTDRLSLRNMSNCDCGEETFTLAPNGRIYMCPAFYYNDVNSNIGDLKDGIHIKNKYLLKLKEAPICSQCDAYQCNRCKFLNIMTTGEISIPPKNKCLISHIEREESRVLQEQLVELKLLKTDNVIPKLYYSDPLEKI